MTAEAFRRDRFLRATGYNFYVWGAVNLLVTLPLLAALRGAPWPAWAAGLFPIALIVAGIFLSGLNDNRVAKLCGEAIRTRRACRSDQPPSGSMKAGSASVRKFVSGQARALMVKSR